MLVIFYSLITITTKYPYSYGSNLYNKNKTKKSITAADLLYEEVAGLLQQKDEVLWCVVVSGVCPDQAYCVHQRANLTSDFRKIAALHVLKQALEGHQVDADVLCFFQGWKVKM